jgi:hypothetical protein
MTPGNASRNGAPDLHVFAIGVDEHHVVIRPKARPRVRDLALDAQHAEEPLAAISVDVLPVQRAGALEAIGEQNRHIVDGRP